VAGQPLARRPGEERPTAPPWDDALHRRLLALDAAALCDGAAALGLEVGVLQPAIRRVAGAGPMAGIAHPVPCDRDFLPVWQALATAFPGEVLVIAAADRAVVGELFASEAARRGLAGIVVDGFCRDTAHLPAIGLPMYARGATPRAGTTDAARAPVAAAVVGGVAVARGDLVFGDADGVVVAPAAPVRDLVAAAEAVQRREAAILATIRGGGSLFDHANLAEHHAARLSGRPSRLLVRGEPTA
jgi:4-hydroxy-4-methyl-2-oxoglutarate aldolase